VSIVTKKGDKGETGLFYGGRVPKNHPRPEAYGTVDEAMSALGLGRALATKDRVKEIAITVQKDLSIINVELATDLDHYEKIKGMGMVITKEMVDQLDAWVAELEAIVKLPPQFIVPGGSPGSAAFDLARTVIRRAERRAVGLYLDDMLENEQLLAYLNRASDLVFMLARYEDYEEAE